MVNGIPVAIVEHKNPKDGDALERAIKQLRRYEVETPELIGAPQLFNVTHLFDYWYGVTWNATRRGIARWKQTPDETYRFAVQAFFEPTDFLRTLRHWILFYVEDGETRKSVLREHQRRAIDKIVGRCADPAKTRGLIWHTQGSGKTFTLLTAARLILEDKDRFNNATVVLVVDRTELEGQLKGWVERLLGEMQHQDIAVRRAESKDDLQDLLDADFRGLVVSMIHKFEEIRKDSSTATTSTSSSTRRTAPVARDLGSYLMAALPNATIIGFTGTPVGTAAGRLGLVPDLRRAGRGRLPRQVLDPRVDRGRDHAAHQVHDGAVLDAHAGRGPRRGVLRARRGREITDIEELNRVLDRAVGLRTFLGADDRVEQVAEFVANHFRENVLTARLQGLPRRGRPRDLRQVQARPRPASAAGVVGGRLLQEPQRHRRPAAGRRACSCDDREKDVRAVQEGRQRAQDPDRHRQAADRLRRAGALRDVPRQADARPRAAPGDRPREPALRRRRGRPEARRPGRRLRRRPARSSRRRCASTPPTSAARSRTSTP